MARPAARRPGTARRRAIFAASGLIAAAAALALWVRFPRQDEPLPPYTVAVEGGTKDIRSGDAPAADETAVAPPQRISNHSELVVTVRPDTIVSGPVEARAFLVQGVMSTEVFGSIRVAPSGAVRLVFTGAALADRLNGKAVLRVLVGRPRAIRAVDSEAVRGQPASNAVRAVLIPLTLVSAR